MRPLASLIPGGDGGARVVLVMHVGAFEGHGASFKGIVAWGRDPEVRGCQGEALLARCCTRTASTSLTPSSSRQTRGAHRHIRKAVPPPPAPVGGGGGRGRGGRGSRGASAPLASAIGDDLELLVKNTEAARESAARIQATVLAVDETYKKFDLTAQTLVDTVARLDTVLDEAAKWHRAEMNRARVAAQRAGRGRSLSAHSRAGSTSSRPGSRGPSTGGGVAGSGTGGVRSPTATDRAAPRGRTVEHTVRSASRAEADRGRAAARAAAARSTSRSAAAAAAGRNQAAAAVGVPL